MSLYLIGNGPMQTTAAFVAVTTSTAIKTLLQLKPGTLLPVRLVEWGISFDGSAAATPIKVECIETDVAATVTASVNADITKTDGDALLGAATTFDTSATSPLVTGTAATGYTASAEGTITAVRNLDAPKFIPPTTLYEKQFPLGQWPLIQVGKFARIRVTAGAAVNAYCYMVVSI